jgi:hypothetical protein
MTDHTQIGFHGENRRQLAIIGTIHKILFMPIELVGTLTPTSDGSVQFHVTKLDVLKIPSKGLLGGLHVALSDLT